MVVGNGDGSFWFDEYKRPITYYHACTIKSGVVQNLGVAFEDDIAVNSYNGRTVVVLEAAIIERYP